MLVKYAFKFSCCRDTMYPYKRLNGEVATWFCLNNIAERNFDDNQQRKSISTTLSS